MNNKEKVAHFDFSGSQRHWSQQLMSAMIPTLKITKGSWRIPWEISEKKAFIFNVRIYFSLFFIVYVAHFFLVDLPLEKKPIFDWAIYRFGMAFVCAIGFILSFMKNGYFSRHYRLPMALSGIIFVAMQAQSMLWRSEIPYFYTVLIAAIASIALRKSIFESILYLFVAYAVCLKAWLGRPGELPYELSLAFVGIIIVGIARNRMSTDVDAFVANQKHLELQKKFIEAQEEMNDEIRSFLPRELYRRITSAMHRDGKSLLQSMDDLLRLRETKVACLHSDMRGYTLLSKVPNFIERTAIVSQRISTDIVNDFHGIPDRSGDLLFAFFEDIIEGRAVDLALRCALNLSKAYAKLNSEVGAAHRVRRYVVLAYGTAVVGNAGGGDSSRDYEAMGEAANIPSRIDELVKSSEFRRIHDDSSIVMNDSFYRSAIKIFPEIFVQSINLRERSLEIRDMPLEDFVHLLPITNSNIQAIEYPKNRYVSAVVLGADADNQDSYGAAS